MIINLHGKIGKEMGRDKWNLKVASVSEALRAIEANTGKFMKYLHDAHEQNVGFEVIVDGKTCENPNELCMENETIKEIDIIPHIIVSEGVGEIIAGIILIVVAWYVIPYVAQANAIAYGAQGAATYGSAFASGIGAGTFAGWAAGTLATIGGALILSGLYRTIVGAPSIGTLESTESKGSFLFSGPVNQSRQGNPVPIAYGEVICGSQVIDTAITNSNYQGSSASNSNYYSYDDRPSLDLVNLNINQWGFDTSSDATLFPVSEDAQPIRSYNVIDPNTEILE